MLTQLKTYLVQDCPGFPGPAVIEFDGNGARRVEFFRAPGSERTLQRAEQLTRDDDAAHAAVARVRAALPAEGAPDWESLEAGLKTLLREIAS